MSDIGDYDGHDEDCCPNCGGEGVIYSCFEEWACVDPDAGCDLCERRCDWCRPRRGPRHPGAISPEPPENAQ